MFVVDVKFYNELVKPSEFSKELLDEFLRGGYAVEQLIDGEVFIKMTNKYFEDLGEYIKKHPKELCMDYWKRLVDDTKNCGIMTFIERFCVTHSLIKELTDGEVDFCENIGEEL